ncbi:MAG: ABC transporter substrate-binding protein [Oscillospiraceae bacterium]|nr:ABC transporter substrate-binding protein [Oscillospiraceae bacterium]
MKRTICALLALILIFVLASCAAGGGAPAEKTDVRIYVLTGPTGVGAVNMWAASENGEGGENYSFTAAASPDEAVAKLSAGEADIAAVSTNLAAKLYKKTEGGIKILAVNTLGVLNVLDNTGAEINTMSDLKGRKIVTTGQGSNPEYIINYLLRENGIDPQRDVTIEFKADGSELPAVWATEPDSVIIAPQPVATAIKGKYDGSQIALDLTDEWERVNSGSALMMGCIVARADFIEAKPDAVRSFLKDYEASVSAAADDAAKTGELCEKYGIVASAKMAEAAIPRCNLCFITGDKMREGLTGYLKVLFDADPASVGAVPDDGFWYEG